MNINDEIVLLFPENSAQAPITYLSYYFQRALRSFAPQLGKGGMTEEELIQWVQEIALLQPIVRDVALHAIWKFPKTDVLVDLTREDLVFSEDSEEHEEFPPSIFSLEIGEGLLAYLMLKIELAQFQTLEPIRPESYTWTDYIQEVEGNAELQEHLKAAVWDCIPKLNFRESWTSDEIQTILRLCLEELERQKQQKEKETE